MREQPLEKLVAAFLNDLAHMNRSPYTRHAYITDLAQFCAFYTHATELINGGVSLPTIRKRLGHKNLQSTLRDAEQADGTADAEVRIWRRLHSQHRSARED